MLLSIEKDHLEILTDIALSMLNVQELLFISVLFFPPNVLLSLSSYKLIFVKPQKDFSVCVCELLHAKCQVRIRLGHQISMTVLVLNSFHMNHFVPFHCMRQSLYFCSICFIFTITYCIKSLIKGQNYSMSCLRYFILH